MAELIRKENGLRLWLLSKSKYPRIKDLHIHSHSNGLTLKVVTNKGHTEHFDIDLKSTTEDFGNLLGYIHRKIEQHNL
ncbi:MAG: hypothetical protein HC919_04585 [Oscillatoriales cyanobacterium SM2_2_1]|jgi:hypothetical protein|nr:hypothetical protein [Oscillatoriales cyanobacterium SM2_2_1]